MYDIIKFDILKMFFSCTTLYPKMDTTLYPKMDTKEYEGYIRIRIQGYINEF